MSQGSKPPSEERTATVCSLPLASAHIQNRIVPDKAGSFFRVDCSPDRHAKAILDILNDAIVNTTALYDYEPRTLDSVLHWFEAKRAGNYPVIGIEDERRALAGFASYGPFRAYPAYKYTVEHSVYVRADSRRSGIGRLLLTQLCDRAREQQYHMLVGVIDAGNHASIRLHKSLGFIQAGTVRQAGFKFGRWLDVAFYQLILDTPAEPVDG
jgi:phosphinothricin acetyltransferase